MNEGQTYRNKLSKVFPTDAVKVLDVMGDGWLRGPSGVGMEHKEDPLKTFVVNDGIGARAGSNPKCEEESKTLGAVGAAVGKLNESTLILLARLATGVSVTLEV